MVKSAQSIAKQTIEQFSPPDLYINRELSWLDFNARVLECAQNPLIPLLERIKFMSIFASNLDEFFMVRVAGLKRRNQSGIEFTSSDGLSARQQLELVLQQARKLATKQAKIFLHELVPLLAQNKIILVTWKKLPKKNQDTLTQIFKKEIFPILTPLAVDLAHPFPYISGLSINLGVRLKNAKGEKLFARIKVPNNVQRFISVEESDGKYTFLPIEELIAAHLELLFPGMKILEYKAFRITRNADFTVSEDKDENLLQALERELARRRFGTPVRLEIAKDTSEAMLKIITSELELTDKEIIRLPGLLNLADLFQLYKAIDRPTLKYPIFIPTTHRAFQELGENSSSNIFEKLGKEDILVHHPYQSFSTSVQEFIEQAATDPQVLAIKQTLYRTSGNSPIINSLIKAAQAGKQVVVIIEVQARFDEENNITWGRKLEKAGAHVTYGIVGLKTHCKVCLVVRREGNGINRYCHIGTGNYNSKTARYYEDLGLFTSTQEIGADLTHLFNTLTGYSAGNSYHNLLVSPHNIRSGIISRIEQEVSAKQANKKAGIRIKVNSIVDEKVINALYKASQAGVKVEVLVRSICSLRAGVPRLSENITVRSILGRFLEHSRIFNFASTDEYWIGSSDMMHRNLDRRVEVLVQVKNKNLTEQLKQILNLAFSKQIKYWQLTPKNTWKYISTKDSYDYQNELTTLYN